MTRYLIRKHYEATIANTREDYRIHDSYIGNDFVFLYEEPGTELIKEYGYKSKAGATRAFKTAQKNAKDETSRGFWNVTAELLEYHISFKKGGVLFPYYVPFDLWLWIGHNMQLDEYNELPEKEQDSLSGDYMRDRLAHINKNRKEECICLHCE